MNSRLYDLLETFGLKDRLMRFTEDTKIRFKVIDYNEVNVILKEKRAASLRFLSDSVRSGIDTMGDV